MNSVGSSSSWLRRPGTHPTRRHTRRFDSRHSWKNSPPASPSSMPGSRAYVLLTSNTRSNESANPASSAALVLHGLPLHSRCPWVCRTAAGHQGLQRENGCRRDQGLTEWRSVGARVDSEQRQTGLPSQSDRALGQATGGGIKDRAKETAFHAQQLALASSLLRATFSRLTVRMFYAYRASSRIVFAEIVGSYPRRLPVPGSARQTGRAARRVPACLPPHRG